MTDKEIKRKLKAALKQIREVTADGKAQFGIILKNYLDFMSEFYPEYTAVIINSKHANEACAALDWPFVEDTTKSAYIGEYKNIKTFITPNVKVDDIYFCIRSDYTCVDIYKPYMPVAPEELKELLWTDKSENKLN